MASSSSNHLDRTPKLRVAAKIDSDRTSKVRVVAKIRGFTGLEAELPNGVSWISAKKPNGEASETVTLSFGEQSAR